MSQAKVDRYKEEKKNRKKTMAKEKRLHLLAVVCGWLVVIALAGWAGVSGYRIYESNEAHGLQLHGLSPGLLP